MPHEKIAGNSTDSQTKKYVTNENYYAVLSVNVIKFMT